MQDDTWEPVMKLDLLLPMGIPVDHIVTAAQWEMSFCMMFNRSNS